MAIVAPSDPGFAADVASLLSAGQLPSFQPILPFSIVVKNETPRPIVGLCIRFAITDAQGHSTQMIQVHSGIPPKGKPVMTPGQSRLIAIEEGYSYAASGSRFGAGLHHPLAYYTSARSVVASIDSVVFDNGLFAGPDLAGSFANYTARLSADQAVASAILSYKAQPVAGLETYLTNTAKLDRAEAPAGSVPDTYTRRMSQQCRAYQSLLALKGQAVVLASAASLLKDSTSFSIYK